MSAIKEAMDTKDFRCHGSPVMAAKETIDNHFKSQRTRHALSARSENSAWRHPNERGDNIDGAEEGSSINGGLHNNQLELSSQDDDPSRRNGSATQDNKVGVH